MRILFLTRTYPPDAGAVGHLVKELGDALSENGHQVSVVAAGARGEMSVPGKTTVVRAGGLAFSRKSHWRRALAYFSLYPALFWSAFRRPAPEIIVTTTDPPLQALFGVMLKIVFDCKLVHWCQDIYPELAENAGVIAENGLLAKCLRWISTQSLLRHDRIVSLGRCMTARLREREIPAEQIVEIANWTQPDWLRPVPLLGNSFYEREKLAGRFVVLYSGNLGIAHSFEEILEAAQILQTTTPDVLFLFIGEGARRAEVAQKAAARSLGNIRFLSAQPWKTLPESLSAADLHLVSLRKGLAGLVVPSKFYGGMAAGRPCLFIGPAESEIARLIIEQQTGRVTAPGDGRELAKAILDYRNSRSQLDADGTRARALGIDSHATKAAKHFDELFASL